MNWMKCLLKKKRPTMTLSALMMRTLTTKMPTRNSRDSERRGSIPTVAKSRRLTGGRLLFFPRFHPRGALGFFYCLVGTFYDDRPRMPPIIQLWLYPQLYDRSPCAFRSFPSAPTGKV